VRFLDQSLVHEVLRRALVDALGQGGVPELVLNPGTNHQAEPMGTSLPWSFGQGSLTPNAPWSAGAGGSTGGGWTAGASAPATGAWSPGALAPGTDARIGLTGGNSTVQSLIKPLTPLGQFRNTFIIAMDDEGIAIIDQHVAHERILFEQIAERLTTGRVEVQALLTPVVLELSTGEHQTLLSHVGELEKLGFECEDFGGNSLRITAVPALLEWKHVDAALRAVASDLDGLSPGASIDIALRQMAATMACHAAVKANDPLTREKMQYLLDELRRTSHSTVCPHGRPVVLRLTRREIERTFERI
jgi:DNA mismatch repair protein MutL